MTHLASSRASIVRHADDLAATGIDLGDKPERPDPDANIASDVGANLRQLRTQAQLSLDALAQLPGVSRAMLGQIELGRSVPSIATLCKVARALDVPVASFLGHAREPGEVILRASESPVTLSNRGRVSTRPLSPPGQSGRTEFLEVRLTRLAVECLPAAPAGTRANLVVVRGSLVVTVDERQHTLATGDAIHFAADQPHSLRNLADSDAVLYLVRSYVRAPA